MRVAPLGEGLHLAPSLLPELAALATCRWALAALVSAQ